MTDHPDTNHAIKKLKTEEVESELQYQHLSLHQNIDPKDNQRLEELWKANSSISNSEKRFNLHNDVNQTFKDECKENAKEDSSKDTVKKEDNPVKQDQVETKENDRKPKKRVALLLSYSGTGYKGMQVNPGAATIELDLLKALALSGAVSADNAMDPVKIGFQRAARTDKGVHALGQVVSFKMIQDDSQDFISKINAHLPPQIRCWTAIRTINSFQAKNNCDSRIYEYILPTYVFDLPSVDWYSNPTNLGSSREQKPVPLKTWQEKTEYTCNDVQLQHFRTILKNFEGSNNHHNFTIGKNFNDKSCKRHILSFTCSDPFKRQNLEWVSCKIHGQSFMLHQIRKMIGLAILMTRTKTSPALIPKTFTRTKLNIPRAPALGLLLERILYDSYNKRLERLPQSESKNPIDPSLVSSQIDAFKQEWIYPKIVQEEIDNNSFQEWTKSIDERPWEYAWYLQPNGEIMESMRFIQTNSNENSTTEMSNNG